MFSEKAVKTFEGCRFCPMCRHLCPIGLKTGSENNTPRAKALLANYVTRGMEYTAEMASDMYECCLCYACATDCESGYEPPLYIREARTMAIVDGLAPEPVMRLVDNLEKTGSIFGVPPAERFAALGAAAAVLPEAAETLVYVGATTSCKTPGLAAALISLMNKAGANVAVLRDEPQSGAELGDLIGFVDDVRAVARTCADRINATGAKQVVVLDPPAARMFKQQYSEWNISLAPDVVTATAWCADMLAQGVLKPSKANISATYQDDSVLTRELDETEPPRAIMAALGVDLKEMFLNRKAVKNAGTVLLNEYAPRLTTLTGEGRWADALRAKVPVLLAASPEVVHVMGKTAPDGMTLQDVFTLLDLHC